MATLELELYNEKRDDLWTTIRVYLENGKIELSGYDSGKTTKDAWGSGGYEYFLSLDKDNADKLFKKLEIADKSDDKKLNILKERFDWSKGFSDFQKYCEKNEIKTEFFNWVEID